MKILILYYSKTGHTLEAVDAVAEGIRSAGSQAEIVATSDFNAEEVADYDGLLLGSPCRAGSITRGGVAKPIHKALDLLPQNGLKGKRCGGVSVHSRFGGKTTVGTLGRLVSEKGCEDYRPGPVARAGVAFSLWKGPSVRSQDVDLFKAYGAEFVA